MHRMQVQSGRLDGHCLHGCLMQAGPQLRVRRREGQHMWEGWRLGRGAGAMEGVLRGLWVWAQLPH